ncbi:MAG: hypothetical protein PWP46_1736 [Fusobacteriaceae bacterium]|jgi:predicted amidohydrolase|nr:Nitrilase/cyanide hydratase and apolipoprotein N-acyltransferase [Fusobacteriales bacterium]MDN5304850.1 hypothetical protein [Fusobacteriaceae bacterium]
MKLKVALAQIKPYLGDVEKNIKILQENIEKAISEKADIIVFPELSLTGYFLKDMVPVVAKWVEDGEIPEILLEYSKKISIIFGGVEESKDHNFYNSAFYLEDGKLIHTHRKVYLPTYGMFDEYRYFSRGDKIRAFDTKFGRIGMLICEDAWHGSTMYILNQDKADYIFVLANSPSREYQNEKPANILTWENMLKTYADMFNSYVVFSHRVGYEDGINFAGNSMVVDPFGKIEDRLSSFEVDFKIVELEKQKIRRARIYTPIQKDEDIHLTIRELNRIAQERK